MLMDTEMKDWASIGLVAAMELPSLDGWLHGRVVYDVNHHLKLCFSPSLVPQVVMAGWQCFNHMSHSLMGTER